MFCEECGTKNRKNANFCKECGAKINKNETELLEKNEVIVSKPTYKEIGPSQKKNKSFGKKKVLIILLIIVMLVFIAATLIFANSLKPKMVAQKYFVALMEEDGDILYKYLGVENKGITSKKIFEEVYDNESEDLLNYKVVNESITTSGLEASVVIEYTLEDSVKTNEKRIELVKDKEKILLFFDKWIIADKSSIVVNDNNLKVPKGATVKLENIIIDKTYIDSESKKDYDNYVIPQMFQGEYDAVVTLKNGIVLTSDVKIGNSGVTDLLSLKTSESVENELEKKLGSTIDSLYASAIDNKKFDSISEEYKYENGDLSKLEKSYNDFEDSLSDNLKKFKVTEIDIASCEVTAEGYLSVSAEVEYDYTVTYSFLGNEETKNKDSDDKMNFVFDYSNGEYKLVDVNSMTTYFSRY